VSLDFWAPCDFWSLVPCQMYSWQRFSSIPWAFFSLVTVSFAVQKLFSLV
jgi:hypothetical protein